MGFTHRQLFQKHMAPTSDAPLALEIKSAEHIYLTDTAGKKYIDLISGIAVSNVGHASHGLWRIHSKSSSAAF
jgi:acetylornithine/succinyldiaminopimelate/putrescine aminotransferase